VSAWKAREIQEGPLRKIREAVDDGRQKRMSLSQAERAEQAREMAEIRETHRRLKAEAMAREERRRAA
jgi:hypothetical protein